MSRRWSLPLAVSLGLLGACSRSSPAAPPAAPAPGAPAAVAPAAPAGDPHADHAGHAHAEPAPSAPPSGATGEPTPAPAPAAAGEQGHAAGGHAHGSPHGGVVVSAPGGGHVEAKLERSGRVTVWLLDDREQTVSAQGATGRVRLAVAGAQDAPLAFDAAQNALTAQVAAPTTDHAVGLVTVARPDGRSTNVRVTFHLEGGGH